MTQANYVTFSNNLDTRFLNPFEKGQSKGASFFGHRYGNAQFIFIVCATISLFLIQLLSDDFNKALIMILLVLYYIYLYYNLSCFLVPDNHERCFTLAWTCITTVIFITIIVLFHNSIFKKKENKKSKKKKKNIGGHKQTNLLADLNDNFSLLINQIKGGDSCNKEEKHTGGGSCNRKEKKSGGNNCDKEEKYSGGDSCNKEEKYSGGGSCNRKEKKNSGGYNCNRKEKYSGGQEQNITLEEYLKNQAELN